MPVYDYQCAQCGGFTLVRPMSQSAQAGDCPTCRSAAPRVIGAGLMLARLSVAERTARDGNERSAHAPRESRQGGLRHGAACGCCSGGRRAAGLAGAQGPKGFPGRRPWQISH